MSVTQAEMDKYFETAGAEVPPAITEAEKVEATTPPPDLEVKPVETKAVEQPKLETKPEGEVQVQLEGKTVPLSELIQERKERQAWQTTAAQQQQQLSETLKMLQERAKLIPENERSQAPDPNSDPQGYAVWEYERLRKESAENAAWRQQQTQLAQQNQQLQQAAAWTQAQEAEYTKTQPKYPDAFKFAVEARTKEFTALGLNPAQIQQALQADNQQILGLAIQQSKNPAQLIWDYAQAKGFQIVAEQKKVPDLDDKVKTITKGQEAAKGVSGTSGGAPSEINNLQDLAAASSDMSDDEFSKAFDKLVPKMKGKYV